MKSSRSFLEELRKGREMALGDAVSYLPSLFKDHRDVYWLASLIKSGFVDIWLTQDDKPWKEMNERELTLQLYMSGVVGIGQDYLGVRLSGADFKGEKVFCTAKTDLYFEELEEKRVERWFAAFLAVLAAVLSAWATRVFGL